MRIHSDVLTGHDLSMATSAAGMQGVYLLDISPRIHQSRSRGRAFEVKLGGNSSFKTQSDSRVNAATWDEWGIFLADLFRRDMEMITPAYPTLDEFVWTTAGRFNTLQWADQHKRHKWDYDGRAVTRSYYAYACGCGARLRRMAQGRRFADLAI